MPFILEGHGDAISVISPESFLEAIIEFLVPFTAEEGFDLFATGQKFVAISPDRIFGVTKHDFLRVTRIPEVFRVLNLLKRSFFRKGGSDFRSEERRVGKSVDLGGRR